MHGSSMDRWIDRCGEEMGGIGKDRRDLTGVLPPLYGSSVGTQVHPQGGCAQCGHLQKENHT